MKLKFLSTLLIANHIFAADISMTAGDAAGATSFNAAGKWSNTAAPSAGNNYFNAKQLLRTPANTTTAYTFAGDALTITGDLPGTVNFNQGIIFKGSATTATTITINNLTVNGGFLRQGSADTNPLVYAGNLAVGTNGCGFHIQGPTSVSALVSGSGTITVYDNGSTAAGRTVTLTNGSNTFNGSISLPTADRSRFALSSTGKLNFTIGATGVNNSITGAGVLTLDGTFNIDLTNAGTTVGNSWTLVNTATLVETYNTAFNLTGFTSSGTTAGSRLWTKTVGSTIYRYTEATGVLAVINPDGDGDGLPDAWETANSLDPNDATGNNGAAGDPDGDGATNAQEYAAGTNPQSNTSWPDTDADGMKDAWEVANFGNLLHGPSEDFDADGETNLAEFTGNTSPIDRTSFTDSDSDGMPDAWETAKFGNLSHDGTADTDGDTFSDLDEFLANSDPNDVNWTPDKAKITHRWSFTNSLNDSVGSSNATITDPDANNTVGGVATLGATDVTLAGGANGTSDYINLGSNLLQGLKTPVTLELWATEVSVQNWARIFDFGSGTAEYNMMSWTQGTNTAQDRVQWLDNTGTNNLDNTFQPYDLGTKYHIIITIEPGKGSAGKTLVTYYGAPVGSSLALKGSYSSANTLETFNDAHLWLGRSHYTGDNTANAKYDESRIWNGVLSSTYRDAYQSIGPDSLDINDNDSDGMPNGWETANGLNPNDPSDASTDPDGDKFTNLDEYTANTNPNVQFSSPDTDADGLTDGWEVHWFTASPTETLNDIITKWSAADDPDGDLSYNYQEYLANTNPTSNTSFADLDGDGMGDGHILKTDDVLGTTSFNAGLNWDNVTAPVAGGIYTVAYRLRTPEGTGSYTFAGNRLSIAPGGKLTLKNGTGTTTAPLRLAGGILENGTSGNQACTVAGTLEVFGSSTSIVDMPNAARTITVNSVVSGTGNLNVTGSGTLILAGTNTWVGNLSTAAPFQLATTGTHKFKPLANGVNNSISGAGAVTFNGAFNIDTSSANTTVGNTWNLVTATGTKTYAAGFTITGFTADTASPGSRKWTNTSNFQFDEATGVLSVVQSGFTSWITGTFAGGATVPSGQQGLTADPDGDGLNNLLEYAFAGNDPTVGNGSLGTISGNTVTFNKRALAVTNGDVTYGIEESTSLTGTWNPITPTVNNSTTISYTYTPNGNKDFFRATATK